MKIDKFGTNPPEKLNPKELREKIKSDSSFFSHIEGTSHTGQTPGSNLTQSSNAVRAELQQIANSTNLTDPAEVSTAILASAKLMVQSRLTEKHRETEQGAEIVEYLGNFLAKDPLMKSKIVDVLTKLKSD
jgi:response regulator RpfG family c-di-GMP phosphodiesterase